MVKSAFCCGNHSDTNSRFGLQTRDSPATLHKWCGYLAREVWAAAAAFADEHSPQTSVLRHDVSLFPPRDERILKARHAFVSQRPTSRAALHQRRRNLMVWIHPQVRGNRRYHYGGGRTKGHGAQEHFFPPRKSIYIFFLYIHYLSDSKPSEGKRNKIYFVQCDVGRQTQSKGQVPQDRLHSALM